MDRASRFIWELDCGKKDRRLFQKAIKTLDKIARQTHDLSIFTDGERRYGNLLFEICYDSGEQWKTRTTQEDIPKRSALLESRIKVHKRIKKVESAPNIRAHGRNILRQLALLQRLTSMPIMPKRSFTAPQVCHSSKKDQYVCQSNHRIAEAVTSILGGAQFSSCSFYHPSSSRCRFGHLREAADGAGNFPDSNGISDDFKRQNRSHHTEPVLILQKFLKRVSASVSGNRMVCFSLQLAGIMFDPCSMLTLFHALQPILAYMGGVRLPRAILRGARGGSHGSRDGRGDLFVEAALPHLPLLLSFLLAGSEVGFAAVQDVLEPGQAHGGSALKSPGHPHRAWYT